MNNSFMEMSHKDFLNILYDKKNPRAEITITPIEDYEIWNAK